MLLNTIDPTWRDMIGFFLGLIAFMLMLALLMYIAMNGKPLLDAFLKAKTQPGCWELKALEGKVYRFNNCTGEAVPVNPASPASAAASR